MPDFSYWSHFLLSLFNIVVLESLLSFDNAAMIAIMVKHLPEREKSRARLYGLIGAVVLRAAALFVVQYLITMGWIKIVGGAWLLWMAYKGLTPKIDSIEEGSLKPAKNTGFWPTVGAVLIADAVFSIDNLIAIVAMSTDYTVILAGTVFGMGSMYFAAGMFSKLMHRHPVIETIAYYVIAALGLKVMTSGTLSYLPHTWFTAFMESHTTDMVFSTLILGAFLSPMLLELAKANRSAATGLLLLLTLGGCERSNYLKQRENLIRQRFGETAQIVAQLEEEGTNRDVYLITKGDTLAMVRFVSYYQEEHIKEITFIRK